MDAGTCLQKLQYAGILSFAKYKDIIRLSAQATPAPGEEQKKWTETICFEQTYLPHVSPSTAEPSSVPPIYVVIEIKRHTACGFPQAVCR